MSSGIRVLTVVTLDNGNEAIYLNDRLKDDDSTIYACDIAKIAGDKPIIFKHIVLEELPAKWPRSLKDLIE